MRRRAAWLGGAGSLPAGLRSVGLLPPLRTPPQPAVTPFPAGMAAIWDATSLSSLADGAAVAGWTDTVGGVAFAQVSSASRPTLAADALGSGEPRLRFNGSQFLTASRTGGGVSLATLIDGGTHTTYIVATGIGASGYGCAFGATAGDNSYFALADGSLIGRFDGNVMARRCRSPAAARWRSGSVRRPTRPAAQERGCNAPMPMAAAPPR